MAKKKEKFEEIKIRLTLEEKQLIKNAAALKNITMTQLILDSTVPTAKRVIENITYKEKRSIASFFYLCKHYIMYYIICLISSFLTFLGLFLLLFYYTSSYFLTAILSS